VVEPTDKCLRPARPTPCPSYYVVSSAGLVVPISDPVWVMFLIYSLLSSCLVRYSRKILAMLPPAPRSTSSMSKPYLLPTVFLPLFLLFLPMASLMPNLVVSLLKSLNLVSSICVSVILPIVPVTGCLLSKSVVCGAVLALVIVVVFSSCCVAPSSPSTV